MFPEFQTGCNLHFVHHSYVTVPRIKNTYVLIIFLTTICQVHFLSMVQSTLGKWKRQSSPPGVSFCNSRTTWQPTWLPTWHIGFAVTLNYPPATRSKHPPHQSRGSVIWHVHLQSHATRCSVTWHVHLHRALSSLQCFFAWLSYITAPRLITCPTRSPRSGFIGLSCNSPGRHIFIVF